MSFNQLQLSEILWVALHNSQQSFDGTNRKLLRFSPASVEVRGKQDHWESPLAPEVVDDEPNQEKKKDPQYNAQCDS